MFRMVEERLGLKKVKFLYTFTFGDFALCNFALYSACISMYVGLILSSVFMYIAC